MSADLARLSQWLDDANTLRAPEAVTWHRVMKIAEETGEVTKAMMGWTGANPRKGVTHGVSDVINELLDVAVTALCAAEHLTGNEGRSTDLLLDHVDFLVERAEKSGLVTD